jgi:hypothetical protein
MKPSKLSALIEEFSVNAGLRNVGPDNRHRPDAMESDDFGMGHYYAYSLLTRFVRKATRLGVLQIADTVPIHPATSPSSSLPRSAGRPPPGQSTARCTKR